MNSRLETAIEDMGSRTGQSFSDLFSDFLDIALGLLCNNPSEQQRKLMSDTFGDASRKAAFCYALEAYGEAADGYRDPLGDMFMHRISHGSNGQVFTPEHICDFMSRIADPRSETLNDPCCGSGRLMLAGLKVARENGAEPLIYANDLSYTCARMCLMNLLFQSARGEVSCGDALRMDIASFRFFRMDRVMMPGGSWMSTYWRYTLSDVDEVDGLRNAWMQELARNGILVETTAPASEEEHHGTGSPQEFCGGKDERRPDRLTAVPKAVQLEFEF